MIRCFYHKAETKLFFSLHLLQTNNRPTTIPSKLLYKFDVHGYVHQNTNLIEMANKMKLCRTVYYSIVP
jgi:hypothetical protein